MAHAFCLWGRAFVETISCNTDWQSIGTASETFFLKQRVWQSGGRDRRIRTSHQPQLYGVGGGFRPAWAAWDPVLKQKQSILELLIITASLEVHSLENSAHYIHSLWVRNISRNNVLQYNHIQGTLLTKNSVFVYIYLGRCNSSLCFWIFKFVFVVFCV